MSSLFPSRVLLAIRITALVIATRKITIVDKPEAVLLFQRLRKHTFRKSPRTRTLARALAESMDEVSISPEERDRRSAEQLQAQEY
ncbi:hypothetical protein OSTOST_02908, partial [Ostertagia ostertagi]